MGSGGSVPERRSLQFNSNEVFPVFYQSGDMTGAQLVLPPVVSGMIHIPDCERKPASMEELSWLMVHGHFVTPMLASMLHSTTQCRPDTSQSIRKCLLSTVSCPAAAPPPPTSQHNNGREFLPQIIDELLDPPLPEEAAHPNAADIENRERALYVQSHMVHLKPFLLGVVKSVLQQRPQEEREAREMDADHQTEAHRKNRMIRRLRRTALAKMNPVAGTSAHFPFLLGSSRIVPDPSARPQPDQSGCWAEFFRNAMESSVDDVKLAYRMMFRTALPAVQRAMFGCDDGVITHHAGLCIHRFDGESGWRSASRFLRQQQAFADVLSRDSRGSHIHFPATQLISWVGARFLITAPISPNPSTTESTIIGRTEDNTTQNEILSDRESFDAGSSLQEGTLYTLPPFLLGHVHMSLGRAARLLGLPGILPTEVHIIRSSDGFLYSAPPVVDEVGVGVGVLPGVEPASGLNTAASHALARVELLLKMAGERQSVPRSSNSSETDPSRGALREALCSAVPCFAHEWGGCAAWQSEDVSEVLHSGDWASVQEALKEYLHLHGIGFCHLGAVAREMRVSHKGSPAALSVFVEMGARGFKSILLSRWRRVWRAEGLEDKMQEACLVAGDLFALLISKCAAGRAFWEHEMAEEVFKLHGYEDIHCALIPKIQLFRRACELTGVVVGGDVAATVRAPGQISHIVVHQIRPVVKALRPVSFSESVWRQASNATERSAVREVAIRPTTIAEAVAPRQVRKVCDVGTMSAADIDTVTAALSDSHAILAGGRSSGEESFP